MSCPYCNSPVLLNDWAGNHWYKCGTTKTFRSESCVDREPLATELRNALARIKRLEEEVDKNISLKTSSYLNANPGSFTPSEWLDLLLACQDGRTTCMRVLQIIEREMDFIRNPKKHVFWGAGEQDCPKDIKAPNGELHTLMCKICGEKSPKYAECKAKEAKP